MTIFAHHQRGHWDWHSMVCCNVLIGSDLALCPTIFGHLTVGDVHMQHAGTAIVLQVSKGLGSMTIFAHHQRGRRDWHSMVCYYYYCNVLI